MPITSVKFTNFKAFQDNSISLRGMNILVGPNNCGKSTVLSAFRILEQGLRTARSRRPSLVKTHTNDDAPGYIIPENSVPISLENVHHNYDESDGRIEFRYSNSNRLVIYFPANGGVRFYWENTQYPITSVSDFKKAFPDQIQVIPILGPVEQNEVIVQDNTLRREAGTPRASRHFRNYWWKNPNGFDAFREMVEKTWQGMSIEKPEKVSPLEARLTMFVLEKRISRELYWSGFGFQIWCQLLTHISRCSQSDILAIDEPEVYLHPEVQRQLLGILREVKPRVLLATHSVEIMGEADPSEILLVDKSKPKVRRLNDIEGVQQAIDNIGSIQNVVLTELARNERMLFVERFKDFKILKRFAKVLGYEKLASGNGLTPFESGGFGSWSRVQGLAWGLRKTIGSNVQIAAIYDRDYRCDEECEHLVKKLEEEISFARFHRRKEIENYLLSPIALKRAIASAIKSTPNIKKIPKDEIDTEKLLNRITHKYKSDCSGQFISGYCAFHKKGRKSQATLTIEAVKIFEEKWADLTSRIEMVPGKKKCWENFEKKFKRNMVFP